MTSLEFILKQYENKKISLHEAINDIKSLGYLPIENICKLDLFREKRTGAIEAVLAEGKKNTDLIKIINSYLKHKDRVLITRVNALQLMQIREIFKKKNITIGKYNKTVVISNENVLPIYNDGVVALIGAGTADLEVLEEAKMTIHELGCKTIEINDVGVSGYHRLILEMNKLKNFNPDVIIVAAGREGTLPTIVSSLIDVPVIGLPISSGYGFGGNGIASLLAMLQSCSILTVVNIDAGFVAGCNAAKIANKISLARKNNISDTI